MQEAKKENILLNAEIFCAPNSPVINIYWSFILNFSQVFIFCYNLDVMFFGPLS